MRILVPPPPLAAVEIGEYGEFQPGGSGFKLADTSWGDVNFSAWTYARYLNQRALEDTYTDAFGRTFELDLRQDIQLNKVNLYFKVTSTTQDCSICSTYGRPIPIREKAHRFVVAGNLGWDSRGVHAFRWHRRVARHEKPPRHFSLLAEGGHTTDRRGVLPPQLHFWHLGPRHAGGRSQVSRDARQHLSQLGVSAAELDAGLNTFSAALWWMPSTGEFGPAGGFGDFNHHEKLATSFGVHYTRSREDRQSQPGLEDIQNTQLRLSDGTLLFRPGAFGTEGRINKATYQMSALNAGMKYRGISLSGEYYLRWLDDFDTEGTIPINDLFDHGFQLQASAMVIPKTLQPYLPGLWCSASMEILGTLPSV